MGDRKSNKEKQRRQLLREERQAQAEPIASEHLKPAATVASNLPQLPSDFNHALFERVTLGPRRELTLELSPLTWIGNSGYHNSVVSVRFGGIANFEEVEALFAADYHKQSELAWLRYDAQHPSKPGDLYLHLEFERVEAQIVIHCHSLTVTQSEPHSV